jgi:hypothetical protein
MNIRERIEIGLAPHPYSCNGTSANSVESCQPVGCDPSARVFKPPQRERQIRAKSVAPYGESHRRIPLKTRIGENPPCFEAYCYL